MCRWPDNESQVPAHRATTAEHNSWWPLGSIEIHSDLKKSQLVNESHKVRWILRGYRKKKENQFHNSGWQREYSNLQNSNETTTPIDWHVSVSQKCMKPKADFWKELIIKLSVAIWIPFNGKWKSLPLEIFCCARSVTFRITTSSS